MKKLLAFLLSLFALTGCQNDPVTTRTLPESAKADISYEPNDPADDSETDHEANARSAASSQSVVFQSITNDLTFAQAYSVSFWFFAATEPFQTTRFDRAAIDALPAAQRDKPKVALKSNLRLYASKSLMPGWYLAKGTGSEVIYKFRIVKGEAGLLTVQDENNPPEIDGYKPGHGKLKVSLWNKGGAKPDEATVYFGSTYPDQDTQRFMTTASQVHIFARDGLGASKYQTFCLPAGTYRFAYRNAVGAITSAQADITPAKTVHLKLVF